MATGGAELMVLSEGLGMAGVVWINNGYLFIYYKNLCQLTVECLQTINILNRLRIRLKVPVSERTDRYR